MRAVSGVTDGMDGSPETWLVGLLPVAEHVAVRSGFPTAAGMEVLGPALGLALDTGTRLSVVTGGRADQVDLRGLRMLLDLTERHPDLVRIALVPGGSGLLASESYAVRTRSGGVHAWTGSANVTRADRTRTLRTGLVLDAADERATDYPMAQRLFADIIAAIDDDRAEALTGPVLAQLQARRPGSPTTLADMLERAVDAIEAHASHQEDELPGGIPTGFVDLDRLLGGLRPGMLHLIAGEPAVGTSTLALDLARSAAVHHARSTVFFSMQSSTEDLTMKISSAEGGIPLRNLRHGPMRPQDWTRLAQTMPALAEAPLVLTCPARLDLHGLDQHLSDLEEPARLVIVDPVNSLRLPRRRDGVPRDQEIGAVIAELKALAVDLKIPVVATAALNRGPSPRTDRRPTLDDVRDSAWLVDVADVVILVHRPDVAERGSPGAGEADLIVAKSRLTPTGTVAVAFQGHYSRFVDRA